MRLLARLAPAILILALLAPTHAARAPLFLTPAAAQVPLPLVRVWFWPALTPPTGVAVQPHLQEIVLSELAPAHVRLLVLAYELTNPLVADAIVAARDRGAYVLVIVDENQETDEDTQCVYLQRMRIPVLADQRSGLDHNKVVVADDEALTGSANLTKAGLNTNAENIVAIRDQAAVAEFARYVDTRARDPLCTPYRYQGAKDVKRK
jgi:phosphatidylserine/phosphatidylglycerophosphate/cardiolipin synthase-like enzyme